MSHHTNSKFLPCNHILFSLFDKVCGVTDKIYDSLTNEINLFKVLWFYDNMTDRQRSTAAAQRHFSPYPNTRLRHNPHLEFRKTQILFLTDFLYGMLIFFSTKPFN